MSPIVLDSCTPANNEIKMKTIQNAILCFLSNYRIIFEKSCFQFTPNNALMKKTIGGRKVAVKLHFTSQPSQSMQRRIFIHIAAKAYKMKVLSFLVMLIAKKAMERQSSVVKVITHNIFHLPFTKTVYRNIYIQCS